MREEERDEEEEELRQSELIKVGSTNTISYMLL